MSTAADAVQSFPLITREALFGNPVRSGGTLSPDGKWLGWMAPHEGVMNVFIAPFDKPAEARRMTSAKDRPIPFFSFTRDSASLIYIQDKAGDENFLLYQVNISTGEERTLTPFENTRARVVGGSHTIRDKLLVGLNNRDARYHDVYLLNLTTGSLDLIFQNDSYVGFLADDTLTLRLAMRQNDAGGSDFFDVVDNRVSETPRDSTGLEDSLSTGPAGYTTDGKTLYWIDSRGRNTAALIAEDTASGKKRVIAESERADIGGTLRHPVTGEVEAYSVNYLKTEWVALEPEIEQAFAFLRQRLDGEFGVQSRTEADDKWLVWHDPLTGPTRTLLYDRSAGTLEEFYVTRPELEGAPLQPMHPLEIPSRDGLTLVSYLTLPPGSEGERPSAPVPMVLLVHGGPWARDGYGFNRMHQLLANRGYATLAGLTFTPTTFACGVDIVGPSNLETLLETIPPYWAPMVKQFHERMGNPKTPDGLALLKARSPLHKADRIVRPLLIGQGANDPRVKQSESDQIVAAMEKHGIPVTYVVFPDEGHGFHRPENNLAFTAIAEAFLASVLGGRAEPFDGEVARSTAEIRSGQELVKGLAPA
jgi:dipeptidyl aminopeptidase/acylaminoacyl peptidase